MVRYWIAFVLLCGVGCARAETPAEATQRAVRGTLVPWPSPDAARSGQAEKARASFVSALGVIADGLEHKQRERKSVESDEGKSIENKVAAIALDRKKNPGVYEEIQRVYGGVPTRESGLPPGPFATHMTPEYRLAWEYYLLAPSTMPAPAYWLRAAEAVGEIGDPRSCITLVHAIRAGLSTAGSRASLNECRNCRMVIHALALMANEQALHALDDAFPVAPGLGASDPAVVRRAQAVMYLAGQIRNFTPGKQEAWSMVIAASGEAKQQGIRDLGRSLQKHLR